MGIGPTDRRVLHVSIFYFIIFVLDPGDLAVK